MDYLRLPGLLLQDFLHPEIRHPWGVVAIAGEAGSGKTVTMAHYAHVIAPKMYKDVDLKIYSNFDLVGQHGTIESVDDIINAPRDSILLIDETTNWFDARKWASLPPEMMQPLTQHRHADIQLVFSAQCFNHMDARIRDLSTMIVEVNTWAGRLTSATWFKKSDYELIDRETEEYKSGKAIKKYSFVQTPEVRALYDTKHEYIRALLKEQNQQYKLNNQFA